MMSQADQNKLEKHLSKSKGLKTLSKGLKLAEKTLAKKPVKKSGSKVKAKSRVITSKQATEMVAKTDPNGTWCADGRYCRECGVTITTVVDSQRDACPRCKWTDGDQKKFNASLGRSFKSLHEPLTRGRLYLQKLEKEGRGYSPTK